MRKIRLGIDVGGTFTDAVAVDDTGQVFFAKTPSTPEDQSIGAVRGIRRILSDLGLPPNSVRGVAHGTTVAINTLLERTGAATALITTPGFRDVLHIGRQTRPSLYDLRARRPDPLVPRRWRREVPERTLYTGEVTLPVDSDALQATVEALLAEGVQSIAICFLHSYANPANEQRALAAVREVAPHVPISVSSQILPEFREFERMNTTVMNAYVQPAMDRYISCLTERIADAGVDCALMIMQSSGGMMTAGVAASRSVHTLLSGPAGGMLAAQFLTQVTGERNLITADVGGTSFDVSVVENQEAAIRTEGVIEGFPVKFPHIDIHSIGAGGGSVAWIDTGGALRVGPRSAGAKPGPVSYGLGGEEPTVTDAHVVLGRLGTGLLGGELRLDAGAAREAIRVRLAEPLRLTLEEAAEGILRVVNASMVRAIRVMTVERGVDPRRFILLPFGGAGPLHGVELAQAMGIRRVLVPVAPGNLSAFGLLAAPARYDEVCSHLARQDEVDLSHVARQLDELVAAALTRAKRDGMDTHAATVERRADLRYYGQAYELAVSFPKGPLHAGAWAQVVAGFHKAHERTYGFAKPDDPVEVVNLRATVLCAVGRPDLPEAVELINGVPTVSAIRPVYVGGRWCEAAIYRRNDLLPGQAFTGPAIVEEQGATTVVFPGDMVAVDRWRNLVVEVASGSKDEDR
ncbi:MAG TPA: hydantoinase/oxoprolinase family protein [bacterium]|nr:hydantoinase/oxoprolinase family protein [bacterium]